MYEQIERYIRGELSPGEIDNLWAEFIQDPELYDFFLTEVHLLAIFESEKQHSETLESKDLNPLHL